MEPAIDIAPTESLKAVMRVVRDGILRPDWATGIFSGLPSPREPVPEG
jgi:hypothetical protein